MAEFKINASLYYEDSEGDVVDILNAVDVLRSIVTKIYFVHKQNIGTSEEALDMGALSSPFGWAFFLNRDATNYLEIRSGTGAGNDIIKLPPLCPALFHFGTDISAPFAIANTAACQLFYGCFAP